MSAKRYTEEFKIEAVKQVTERGHAVVDVSVRLGVSGHSLYQWVKQYSLPAPQRDAIKDQQVELRQLKADLKRVTEERDILKKAAVGSTGECNISDLMLISELEQCREQVDLAYLYSKKKVMESMEGRPVA